MSLETSVQNFGVVSGRLPRSFMSCRIELRRVSSSRVHFPVWHLINRNQGFILDLPWHSVPLFSKFWCLQRHSSAGRSINSPIRCQSNCLPTKLGNCIITQLSVCRDLLFKPDIIGLCPLSGLPERMMYLASVVIHRLDPPQRD